MATIVWFCAAAAAIVSALGVVLQRNPFISAIALLGNLASLAVMYVLLSSDFVAAAQVIVYIGPRGEVVGERRRPWQITVASVAAGAILVELALVIGRTGFDTPAAVDEQFGSPQIVGAVFLTKYVGAFELVSLLLLIGAIAAVVLGAGPRPSRVRMDERERRVREARELAATRSGGE
jgi:NADH-quinone oxidoreductase subunit J